MVKVLDLLIDNQYLIYAALGFKLTSTFSWSFYCQLNNQCLIHCLQGKKIQTYMESFLHFFENTATY